MHKAAPLLALVLVACANGITDGAGLADDVLATDGGVPVKKDAGARDASPTTTSTDASSDTSDAAAEDAADSSLPVLDAGKDADVVGAHWATPVCDGTVGASEYGTADNHGASGSQTWYVTWDATSMYVAIDGANLTEGVVLYVGHTGSGLTTGQAYDGTRAQALPFGADAVVYAKQGYTEVRTPSSGAWGTPATSAATLCGSGSTREVVVGWSALGSSGVPKGFRWLGYAVSASGYAYAQEPTVLPAGFIGQTAVFGKQLHVTSTANGVGTFPFQLVE